MTERYSGVIYTERRGETFEGVRVDLDGNWFEGCTFIGCELFVSGDIPYGYADCTFTGCKVRLDGRARMLFYQLGAMLDDESILALAVIARHEGPGDITAH